MSFGFSIGDFIAVLQLANNTRKQFVDAPNQFKAISDEVRSLSTVLQDVDDILPERDLTSQQQTELGDFIKRCRRVLEDLDEKLNNFKELDTSAKGSDGKPRRVWKRFKWDQRDIDEFRSRIASNILLFNTFLGRVSSQALLATKDGVERLHKRQDTQERRQETRERQQEHETILSWLTPNDYAPQQHDFISRRQAGTGQWLLDSTEFKMWADTDKQTLFCPGIPGAGKTILTSVVVEELTTRFQNDRSIGIAYLYCNFRRQDEQKAQDLLASLLKQLTQGRSSFPESIKSLYDSHKDKRTPPSFDEISRVLQSVANLYSRVFIIVDALDECQASNGCRSRFLSEILSLQAKCGANLFATSRFIPEITEKFAGKQSLEIRASNDDVRKYLDIRISQGESRILRRPDLQAEITTEIVKAIDGMFLLAELHLDSLLDMKLPKDIRAALKNLPKGSGAYDRAYQEAMDRVECQGPKSVQFAKQVLSWITCAKRPLTTSELQHALAVEVGEPKLDEDNLPQVEDIVSVCGGLVTVDDESDIIRLVHYTTQEYFERTQTCWFPNTESNITTVCITYLSFSVFEGGFCQTDNEFEKRLRSSQFFEYAARNWGHHAQKTSTLSPRLSQEIVDFLQSEAKVDASSQGLLAVKHYSSHSNYSQEVPRKVMGLHLTAYFGVKAVMQLLLDTGKVEADAKDSDGRTPLSYAAWRGHEAIIWLLLETGKVEASAEDGRGRTPLSWAAESGHEAIIQLLLDTGKVEADAKDSDGRTPLSWAAESGHEAIIQLLLDTGKVKVDAKDSDGRTPLSYAAARGQEAVVQQLLETGKVEADAKDSDGRTPLWYAAGNANEAIIQLLLDTGKVDVEAENGHGRTPLSWAAARGHEAIVKLLLEMGAKPESKDAIGRTPLWWAARNKNGTVKILLTTERVDVDSKDRYNSTPLSTAVRMGHIDSVALFLTKSRALSIEDNFGRSPLWWARSTGRADIADLVLEKHKENGIIVQEDNLPVSTISVLADEDSRYCDVCILGISDKDTYYHCRVCCNGDFDICMECFAMKAVCLDESHTLIKR